MREMTADTNARPMELLLVEDSPADVTLAQHAFGKARVANNVRVARDGEEAMRRLRGEGAFGDHPRPDLILLDLKLPRMDGRAVLAGIKADPALREIPVIVITGSYAERDVRDSYALGANACVFKPNRIEQLAEIVAAVEQFWFGVVALPSRPTARQSDGISRG